MTGIKRDCEFCSAAYYWQPRVSGDNFLERRIQSSYRDAVIHARGQGWFIAESTDGHRDRWYCVQCTDNALRMYAQWIELGLQRMEGPA